MGLTPKAQKYYPPFNTFRSSRINIFYGILAPYMRTKHYTDEHGKHYIAQAESARNHSFRLFFYGGWLNFNPFLILLTSTRQLVFCGYDVGSTEMVVKFAGLYDTLKFNDTFLIDSVFFTEYLSFFRKKETLNNYP